MATHYIRMGSGISGFSCVCAAAIDTQATDMLLQFSLITNVEGPEVADATSPRIGVGANPDIGSEALAM